MGGDTFGDVLCLGTGCSNEMEGTCSFAVQAKVLGEGLCDDQLEALFDEVSDGEVILSQISGSKPLIGTVEKGEELAVSDDLSDLFPFILCRVDTRGVMGTGVQENNGALFGRGQGVEQTLAIETFGLCGEVRVIGDGEVDV